MTKNLLAYGSDEELHHTHHPIFEELQSRMVFVWTNGLVHGYIPQNAIFSLFLQKLNTKKHNFMNDLWHEIKLNI